MRGGRRRILFHRGTFEYIISLENLLTAWYEFRRGKRGKPYVQQFELQLEDNLFALHDELRDGTYRPGPYEQFRINDPKPRLISKALVRDRLVHHALYRVLYPAFDHTFIFDSYSCRKGKGTHRGFKRLVQLARRISKNYARPCWALKCDIKKFFDSVDHAILFALLQERIADARLLTLLRRIIKSFHTAPGKGVPIGNLTSQLFANVYLDPLDKFIEHHLHARYYLRYADDFLLLGSNSGELLGYFVEIARFLRSRLALVIHPDKISLRKLGWGIDFVGYVALPYHEIPRRKTVRRIFKQVVHSNPAKLYFSIPSYLGYLKHVNAYTLSCRLRSLKVIYLKSSN